MHRVARRPNLASMKRLIPVLAAACAIVSCAPATPQGRIDANPKGFAALSAKDQEAARRGQIARGMSPAAVEFAWGPADRRFEGTRQGRHTARWDYAGTEAVYTQSYGPAAYPYGRYRLPAYALGPEVTYIPYRIASVWFLDNKVEGWERVR